MTDHRLQYYQTAYLRGQRHSLSGVYPGRFLTKVVTRPHSCPYFAAFVTVNSPFHIGDLAAKFSWTSRFCTWSAEKGLSYRAIIVGGVFWAVLNLGMSTPPADATVQQSAEVSADDNQRSTRIHVSNTKKPLFFYVNLAKVRACLTLHSRQHDSPEVLLNIIICRNPSMSCFPSLTFFVFFLHRNFYSNMNRWSSLLSAWVSYDPLNC